MRYTSHQKKGVTQDFRKKLTRQLSVAQYSLFLNFFLDNHIASYPNINDLSENFSPFKKAWRARRFLHSRRSTIIQKTIKIQYHIKRKESDTALKRDSSWPEYVRCHRQRPREKMQEHATYIERITPERVA